MGKELIKIDPCFQADISAMDGILQSFAHAPEWKIEGKPLVFPCVAKDFSHTADELQKPAKFSQIHRAEIAQPLCTAIQIALVNALARCGVRPDAVIGHSSGEIAAAYATGALSITEAMIVSYYRGYITKDQKLAGGMATIGLDANTTSKFLRDGVVVACENSPNSITISGNLPQLEEVIEDLKKNRPDVFARYLKVDMAYHSRKYVHREEKS